MEEPPTTLPEDKETRDEEGLVIQGEQRRGKKSIKLSWVIVVVGCCGWEVNSSRRVEETEVGRSNMRINNDTSS